MINRHIKEAIDRRCDWIAEIDSDSYRLFHGIAEGIPGVTIDRYGSELLLQVFRDTLDFDWAVLAESLIELVPGSCAASVVRRGSGKELLAQVGELAPRVTCYEEGRSYWNSLVKAGNDPWFYLDFRASRRFVASVAKDARVANFFSYTGTAGVTAAVAGASRVSNIDFGNWCTSVGDENAELNGVEIRSVRDDFFSVARQWAGAGTKIRKQSRRKQTYKPESFDLVILDPPTYSKGPNGAVDIIQDYPSLAKPCAQMLSSGGWLICSHHHSSVDFDSWQKIVQRTIEKIGRSITEEHRIVPDPDFPMVGEEPLVKVLALKIA